VVAQPTNAGTKASTKRALELRPNLSRSAPDNQEEASMSGKNLLSKLASFLIVALLALTFAAATISAASEFEGAWLTQDTKGNPFKITLSSDGKATGDRADEGLKGTWKAEGDSAVINWDTGWVTKIVKQGDKFQKQAFEKGGASGPPTHSAEAQKQKM
jgi:hypothetical protein